MRKKTPSDAQLWNIMYRRAKNSRNGMTFKQAEGLFFVENHFWPSHDLPLMPEFLADWKLLVKDVPRERLIQPQRKPQHA